MNVNKAAGIDNFSGKFLKHGADVQAKPISELPFYKIFHFSNRLPNCKTKANTGVGTSE